MRILFHNWEYPPQGSGIGRYIYIMADALRTRGHFVVIVTSKYRGSIEKETIPNGVIYRIFETKDIGNLEISEKVLRIATKHKVDIIEGADHLGECEPLLRLAARPPVCIKLHYNDVLRELRYAQVNYYWQYAAVGLACVRQRSKLFRERQSMECADVLTAPSRAILVEARKENIALPSRVSVIPNPGEVINEWTNKEADRPTILFVGRLDFGKGVQYFPRLLARIQKRCPEVLLEVAGGDSYARGVGSINNWLMQKIGNWKDHLSLLGHVSRNDLDGAYRRSWVVIVPSNWDTFPNVILEAMARKKCVIGSCSGGIPEMLENTSQFCEDPASQKFADRVCDCLENEKLRQKLGRNGHEKLVNSYSPDSLVESLLKLYSTVL